MKPIILNMSEMSDSREVYDSKPNRFFAVFIYTILLILVIAIAWSYFGKIDIVVKSEAIIRPNSQISTEYYGVKVHPFRKNSAPLFA